MWGVEVKLWKCVYPLPSPYKHTDISHSNLPPPQAPRRGIRVHGPRLEYLCYEPDIEVAHAGQGDGGKATVASGVLVLPQGDVAGSCGELDKVTYGRAAEGGPGIRGSMNRTKWKNFKKAAARINTRDHK